VYDGPIIDTHHHLWEVRNYPWLLAPPSPKIFGESYELLRRDYLIDDLLADFGANRVVKSVHVQAHYLPDDPVGETRWLQSVADVFGFPQAITGHVKLSDDRAEELLAGHLANANFRGIRDQVHWEPSKLAWQPVDRPDFCLTPAFRRGLALLAGHDVHYELQGFPNQFGYFAELVGGMPELRVLPRPRRPLDRRRRCHLHPLGNRAPPSRRPRKPLCEVLGRQQRQLGAAAPCRIRRPAIQHAPRYVWRRALLLREQFPGREVEEQL
jgi:hypothetical protein